jgi:hypothetical protein
MWNRSGWTTLAALCLAACVDANAPAPTGATTQPAPSAPAQGGSAAPVMTVNQLMRGIFFPLGNTIFFAQADDPDAVPRDAQPSAATNPLSGLFGGWEAVENSALALAESAELLLIPGRACSNGEVVEVRNTDWIEFVADYRAKSVAAYEAALTKDMDAMVEASGYLSESCLACHRVYRREPTQGDPRERCIPGPPVTRR